jgi:hypothetical protein
MCASHLGHRRQLPTPFVFSSSLVTCRDAFGFSGWPFLVVFEENLSTRMGAPERVKKPAGVREDPSHRPLQVVQRKRADLNY